MRATVEPEGGWTPTRTWIITLEHLGYQVTEYRVGGRSVLEITGSLPSASGLRGPRLSW